MKRWAALALFAATVGLYLVMVLWSLPRISSEAGGLIPFDMRPLGYGFEEAKAFLAALTPEGKRFYTQVQHRLDLAYPAMMALSLAVALGWAWRDVPRAVVAAMILVAFAGAGFDYLENSMVGAILDAGPDGVTAGMVRAASSASVLKSAATTVAMTLLVTGAARRGWQGWRRRR
jgi:di/tricarboxylate transporter